MIAVRSLIHAMALCAMLSALSCGGQPSNQDVRLLYGGWKPILPGNRHFYGSQDLSTGANFGHEVIYKPPRPPPPPKDVTILKLRLPDNFGGPMKPDYSFFSPAGPPKPRGKKPRQKLRYPEALFSSPFRNSDKVEIIHPIQDVIRLPEALGSGIEFIGKHNLAAHINIEPSATRIYIKENAKHNMPQMKVGPPHSKRQKPMEHIEVSVVPIKTELLGELVDFKPRGPPRGTRDRGYASEMNRPMFSGPPKNIRRPPPPPPRRPRPESGSYDKEESHFVSSYNRDRRPPPMRSPSGMPKKFVPPPPPPKESYNGHFMMSKPPRPPTRSQIPSASYPKIHPISITSFDKIKPPKFDNGGSYSDILRNPESMNDVKIIQVPFNIQEEEYPRVVIRNPPSSELLKDQTLQLRPNEISMGGSQMTSNEYKEMQTTYEMPTLNFKDYPQSPNIQAPPTSHHTLLSQPETIHFPAPQNSYHMPESNNDYRNPAHTSEPRPPFNVPQMNLPVKFEEHGRPGHNVYESMGTPPDHMPYFTYSPDYTTPSPPTSLKPLELSHSTQFYEQNAKEQHAGDQHEQYYHPGPQSKVYGTHLNPTSSNHHPQEGHHVESNTYEKPKEEDTFKNQYLEPPPSYHHPTYTKDYNIHPSTPMESMQSYNEQDEKNSDAGLSEIGYVKDHESKLYHAYYAPPDHEPPPGYTRLTIDEFEQLFKDANVRVLDKHEAEQSNMTRGDGYDGEYEKVSTNQEEKYHEGYSISDEEEPMDEQVITLDLKPGQTVEEALAELKDIEIGGIKIDPKKLQAGEYGAIEVIEETDTYNKTYYLNGPSSTTPAPYSASLSRQPVYPGPKYTTSTPSTTTTTELPSTKSTARNSTNLFNIGDRRRGNYGRRLTSGKPQG